MKTLAHKRDSTLIVYDADTVQHPAPYLFSEEHWAGLGAVRGEALGRGSALLLDTEFGPAVLRQYLRGGWAAKASRDRYVFTGFENSRPAAEFAILARLCTAGLPAPRPIAAYCLRQGLLYRGWILMGMILDAVPLADLLQERQDNPALWQAIGACIRRFHDYGLVHADLNVRNILVDDSDDIYLIDFDRARLRRGDKRAFESNLRRLHRSLTKHWPACGERQLGRCWSMLEEGYRQQESAA